MATAVLIVCILYFLAVVGSNAEDPYRFYTWNVTYGDIHPLRVTQQGILINGRFPGPTIECVTNDNLIINVFNSLPEPFLLSWNGIQQRRNSWQDGTYGTNCPIPPGTNYTYHLQVKDQIGSYYYFPSLSFHKAAGGFGGIQINSRPRIPVPYSPPDGDYTVLAGDWFVSNHTDLKTKLDQGYDLPSPDGLLINGRGPNGNTFTVEKGKTYRFRISNVGLTTSINFRIEGHLMQLIEVEGSHTVQNSYSTLDVHLGQSYSVLVTADQPPMDYYVTVSSRFTEPDNILTTSSILRYANSGTGGKDTQLQKRDPPAGPTVQIDYSINQARSIRWNLTASGPRPNPQGSYHYGLVTPVKTIRLANSASLVDSKLRYSVNGVSFTPADTPLKLADELNIGGVFTIGSIPDKPKSRGHVQIATSVMGANFRDFYEVIFENEESTVQSWHIDGHSFFVVGMDGGQWSADERLHYNLRDTVARSTVQVYPRSWTAIYLPLDNVGMWNVRSENWGRQYLGQQFYLRVYSPVRSWRDEYPIPGNALLCGRASRASFH
ncbi:laccase 11 [Zostera marina]|uniref:Laccase 11 n=1 Tax=Zostera marina TaxID=29655 RepID=A0A0K9PZG2_ZOSMR|nr:laccase 11 [Zostera marina]